MDTALLHNAVMESCVKSNLGRVLPAKSAAVRFREISPWGKKKNSGLRFVVSVSLGTVL